MAHTLILLRHGESDWNQKNLFTGWVDVDLTDKGRAEAARGGQLLKDAGILPDVVHTSLQRRAINTACLALDAADRHWIPVRRSWRLNERHYGALQGKDKKQTGSGEKVNQGSASSEQAAIMAGYLVGAIEKGADETEGIHATLVDRVEAAATNGLAGADQQIQDAYQQGHEAGLQSG